MVLPIALGAAAMIVAQSLTLGPGHTVSIFTTTAVLTVGALLLALRLDQRRNAKHRPPGVECRAGATVYGAELLPFQEEASPQIASTALVVGWLDVGGDGFAWQPRPRFVKRGAPAVRSHWSEVLEVSAAPASHSAVRRYIRADAFSFLLKDGRSLAVFVTSPEPLYEALARLGIAVISAPSTWGSGDRP